MARSEKQFYECPQMADMAEKILSTYGSWFGEDEWFEASDVYFALISGEQAKRSPDVYIDKNNKEWIKKQTKKKYCIAVWESKWDSWNKTKQQWKIFECLLKIAKVKPDICGYSFMFDMLGWNWERDADTGLTAPPDLLEDKTKENLQLPGYLDADTDEDDTSVEEVLESYGDKPKVKLLKENKA